MTKKEQNKIKYRMKRLARKFCRRNHVYEYFVCSVGALIEKSYLSAYLICLHENKNRITALEKENAELKEALAEWQRTCEAKSDTNAQLIKQLADKNEELKSIAEFQQSSNMARYFQLKSCDLLIAKAKEIIKGLLELGSIGDGDYTYVIEAEQFLKEVSE